MQIKPDTPITDHKGQPVSERRMQGGDVVLVTMTLGDAICNALLTPDDSLEPKEKLKRTKLAERLAAAEEEGEVAELSDAQARRIATCAEAQPQLVYTRIYEAVLGEAELED